MYLTSALSSTDFTDYKWPEVELNRFHAYMTSGAPLWSPPPDRGDKEFRKAFWTAEIKRWLVTRCARPDAYMSSQEIGAAPDRAFLLQRAILDNVAAYYRQHPREKVALGVLLHDTILSDNSEGCCTVSAVRVAELLGCDEKYVRRARELLANELLMGREKRGGLSDRNWPIINRAFAGEALHPTWWLDATSEVPARRGRPKKPRTLDVRPLPEKPRTSNVRPFEKTPDTTSENPGQLTSDDFSIEFTKEKRASAPTDTQTNGQQAMLSALNPEAAARKLYANANVTVSKSGKVEIGAAFRTELLGEGFTESQVDTALVNVCRYIEGNDPEKWMKSVRTACGWAKSDDAKSVAFAARKAGGVTPSRFAK